MEEKKEASGLLDLLTQPSFCVKDNLIVRLNPAAEGLLLTEGTDVRKLLLTGAEEYQAFSGGCLYLKLNLTARGCGAAVRRVNGYDVFVLNPENDAGELQALALAAMELRQPLLNAMLSADRLTQADPETKAQLARLNRGLHQLHRIINNMSDAGRFASSSRQELRNVGKEFAEIFEKAQTLVAHTGVTLTYSGLSGDVYSLADREQLERAVLNMLSNAVKFTPKGGTIAASLSRHGNMLRLSIQDSGCGMEDHILSNVFSRYLRQPLIEDSRHGIGLGMVLIRSAAASHGGTVLIDQPVGTGTRVTMTMEIRPGKGERLRTPIDLPGGQDPGLIELSDCLPASVYET